MSPAQCFRDHALAPTYPRSRAETLRVNGVFGLKMPLTPESYRLQVVGVRDADRSPFYVPRHDSLGVRLPDS